MSATNTGTMKRAAIWRGVVHGALLVGMLGACGGLPPAPAYPKKEDGFSGPQQVKREGIASDKAPPLTLQPGDVLSIDVTSEQPKTIAGMVVDATGRVHLPMAGDIQVGGLGLSEAEGKVQAAMRKFDRFVEVTIQITDNRGQRVTVLGAVTTQGSLQLAPGARIADVIALAGGPMSSANTEGALVPLADLEGAVVTRAGKPLPISVARALRGEAQHNVYAHPGDYIYVPPALGSNISVLGQVGAARVFPYRAGLRLSQALALAGGVTVGADKSDIRVIRGTLAAPRVYTASLADLVDGDTHDVSLQPGDIIFVTDDAIEDIGEVVGVVSPVLSLGFSSAVLAVTLSNSNNGGAVTP